MTEVLLLAIIMIFIVVQTIMNILAIKRINTGGADEQDNICDACKQELDEAPYGMSVCDLCIYNPPSGSDGKPCTMCPAITIETQESEV